MLDLNIPKQAFTDWNVEHESKFTMNLVKWLQRFPKPTPTTPITLYVDQCILRAKFKGCVSKTLTMATLDDWMDEELPLPKVEETNTVNVSLCAYDWDSAIHNLAFGNDVCKLTTTQEQTLAISNMSTEMHEELELTEFEDFTMKEPNVQACYSLSYLYDGCHYVALIHRAMKTSNPTVRLEYAKNWPLQISTELPDKTTIKMWFAPRIEED
jgi:hypothetical protein